MYRIVLFSIVLAMSSLAPADVIFLTPDVVDPFGDAQLTGSCEYAPGFAPGSWHASVPAGFNRIQWNTFWEDLPEGITMGDLVSISYYTNKPTDQVSKDWFLTIYTYPEGDGSDAANWYRSALIAEPMYCANLDAPAGQWNQWSTGAEVNQLRFTDNSSHTGHHNFTLSDLAQGSTSYDYSNERILGISFQVGDAGLGWSSYEGLIDGVQIVFTHGREYSYNLVPEPATVVLLGLGVLVLNCRKRSR